VLTASETERLVEAVADPDPRCARLRRMFDAGPTLFEVQQRLGHRRPSLTPQVYTHLMRERFEEGREKREDGMQATRFRVLPDYDQSAAVFPGSS
jgi:hypothetical protein